MKKALLLLLIICLSPVFSQAQWRLLESTVGKTFSSIRFGGGKIYALSLSTIYTSADYGYTWNTWELNNEITSIDCNETTGFANCYGTGIFSSTDNGMTWGKITSMAFKCTAPAQSGQTVENSM